MSWIVVCTHGGREHIAKHHLERQGYQIYLPVCSERRGDRFATAPLFPRYLFALLDLATDAWRPILSTIGVMSVLLNGERPGVVSDGLVQTIRAREDSVTILPAPEVCPYSAGEAVRIRTGPFSGVDAIFAEALPKRRCALLLGMLGAETRVELALADVA